MKRPRCISAIAPLFCPVLLASCVGGGGGIRLSKRVVIKNIVLQKSKIAYREDFRTKRELLFWNAKIDKSASESERSLRRAEIRKETRDSKFKANNSCTYFVPVQFAWRNKEYKIACDTEGGSRRGAYAILDLKNNVVVHVKTPRYTTGAVVLPIKSKDNKSHLVVLIKHQTTSRSSSLFIFDENFGMVYKEYLGEVPWIAADDNSQNIFYICSSHCNSQDCRNRELWKYSF